MFEYNGRPAACKVQQKKILSEWRSRTSRILHAALKRLYIQVVIEDKRSAACDRLEGVRPLVLAGQRVCATCQYRLIVLSQPSMLYDNQKSFFLLFTFLHIFACQQMIAMKEVLAKGISTAHILLRNANNQFYLASNNFERKTMLPGWMTSYGST